MAQATEVRRTPTAVNPPVNRRAPWPVQFYRSAVGKKWVMALTGLGIVGFVVAHLVGNLKIYLGQEPDGDWAIDVYGHALRELLHPLLPNHVVLWAMRLGLLACFILHIHSAWSLTMMNRRARPDRYQAPRDYVAANFAARSMRWTGVIVLAYLIFHLFDLTWTGTGAEWTRGEVHDNFIASLERPWVATIYMVGAVAVAVHLYHGVWSMFQSMGLNNPRYNAARRGLAVALALTVGIGNLSFPILTLAGVIK